MAYDTKLAEKIRSYLKDIPGLQVEEKEMFRGITFMVHGKMCISVSNDRIMCRFDPALQADILKKKHVEPMRMKEREYKGYAYVKPEGFKAKKDLVYWLKLCLDFNERAKSSKKSRKK
ncbi:MAG: TfoX/Sxy family protein [Turneriella sp.]|nr:TfoX/Sxy family protein [Turneriella sp.]